MGLFRSRKARQVSTAPLPDWDDTRWRSHLRSNSLGTDHHCQIYLDMINTDRKEAARLFKNEDDSGAQKYAESSLRNKRIVKALASLSPLCDALFQRAEPLAGYTTMVQIPEPARSGIVTIIFAAGRLQLSYLTETVAFLREQFGHVHIDGIQKGDGELAPLVNSNVRDALSPMPPDRSEVDAELASAVKEYFGISVSPAASRRVTSTRSVGSTGGSGIGTSVSQQQQQQQQQQMIMKSSTITGGGTSGIALSTHSSELGAPQSPQFSVASSRAAMAQQQQQQQQQQLEIQLRKDATLQQQRRVDDGDDEEFRTNSPRQHSLPPPSPNASFHDASSSSLHAPKRGRTIPARINDLAQSRQQRTVLSSSHVMDPLDDTDNMLVSRYQDILSAIAV